MREGVLGCLETVKVGVSLGIVTGWDLLNQVDLLRFHQGDQRMEKG